MLKFTEKYYKNLLKVINSIRATDKEGNVLDFYGGIEVAANLILTQANHGSKTIFIGNGASAAISSHMATDFWKNGGIRAVAFNDASLLTCISNDFGYEHVFEKPIDMFASSGDVLVAISSSGKSGNILLGIKAVRKKGAKAITLSGFNEDNPLSKLGDINFYVPSTTYGHVEVAHLSICHCLVDTIIEKKNG